MELNEICLKYVTHKLSKLHNYFEKYENLR